MASVKTPTVQFLGTTGHHDVVLSIITEEDYNNLVRSLTIGSHSFTIVSDKHKKELANRIINLYCDDPVMQKYLLEGITHGWLWSTNTYPLDQQVCKLPRHLQLFSYGISLATAATKHNLLKETRVALYFSKAV